jgi:hypothetical protein
MRTSMGGAVRQGVVLAAALATAVTVLGCRSASATLPVEKTTQAASRQGSAVRKAQPVQKVKVDPRMFGVHDSHLTSLAHRSTRSLRLWDAGVTWPDLRPTASGGYSWTRLDDIVRRAHRNGTEVTLALARTPAWAAASRAHKLPTDAPNLTKWSRYVKAVMTRYAPKHWHYLGIANFQIWNEPNISTFWTGTPKQMAQLIRAAHDIRDKVNPKAKVIAPSMVARLSYQQRWIQSFYRISLGGRPVWKYVDAAAFSMYPLDTYPVDPRKPDGAKRPATPEDSMRILAQVRGLLRQDKVRASLPIWNTEINYGMRTGAMGGQAAAPINDDTQVAYVMRTFLLNAAQGIRRVDWYAYDMGNLSAGLGGGPLGNTLLTDPSDQAAGALTPAGLAFTRVQGWLRGGTLVGTRTRRPCLVDRQGTYTCTITFATRSARVYWNPYSQGTVTVPASARTKTDQLGTTSPVTGGSRLHVGDQPVLVTSPR